MQAVEGNDAQLFQVKRDDFIEKYLDIRKSIKMQTDTDYYDGRWNKVSNVRLFFTELNIAFLPKDLINNCREELIEYTKHNESIKNYFSTYGTSLETTHNISKATELLNHSVERLARQIVKRKVSIANSFFNYVPKGVASILSTVMVIKI